MPGKVFRETVRDSLFTQVSSEADPPVQKRGLGLGGLAKVAAALVAVAACAAVFWPA